MRGKKKKKDVVRKSFSSFISNYILSFISHERNLNCNKAAYAVFLYKVYQIFKLYYVHFVPHTLQKYDDLLLNIQYLPRKAVEKRQAKTFFLSFVSFPSTFELKKFPSFFCFLWYSRWKLGLIRGGETLLKNSIIKTQEQEI